MSVKTATAGLHRRAKITGNHLKQPPEGLTQPRKPSLRSVCTGTDDARMREGEAIR